MSHSCTTPSRRPESTRRPPPFDASACPAQQMHSIPFSLACSPSFTTTFCSSTEQTCHCGGNVQQAVSVGSEARPQPPGIWTFQSPHGVSWLETGCPGTQHVHQLWWLDTFRRPVSSAVTMRILRRTAKLHVAFSGRYFSAKVDKFISEFSSKAPAEQLRTAEIPHAPSLAAGCIRSVISGYLP